MMGAGDDDDGDDAKCPGDSNAVWMFMTITA